MTDTLTLAEAVAELDTRSATWEAARERELREGPHELAGESMGMSKAYKCAADILRRVDTGEAERLLDALPVPCYISRQAWTDDAGETVGLVTVTECQHRRAIVYGKGETLRAALRELAKEAGNGN